MVFKGALYCFQSAFYDTCARREYASSEPRAYGNECLSRSAITMAQRLLCNGSSARKLRQLRSCLRSRTDKVCLTQTRRNSFCNNRSFVPCSFNYPIPRSKSLLKIVNRHCGACAFLTMLPFHKVLLFNFLRRSLLRRSSQQLNHFDMNHSSSPSISVRKFAQVMASRMTFGALLFSSDLAFKQCARNVLWILFYTESRLCYSIMSTMCLWVDCDLYFANIWRFCYYSFVIHFQLQVSASLSLSILETAD